MLSVSEAQANVLQRTDCCPVETTPLTSQALGRVLAEEIVSDIDVPPYDKSLMDGYAVRAEDVAQDATELQVIEEVHAGEVPQKEIQPGQTIRIMTGAIIPGGADAVVMKEKTKPGSEASVVIEAPDTSAGQNILRQGSEMKCDDVVLRPGSVLRPQEFGLLATVGRTAVKLISVPRVAIVSTGDELVEPSEKPDTGQIRNGNGPMLVAQTVRAGALPRYLGIARDQIEHLQSLIREGLESSLLLLSGGVSAGQRDLVPDVLQKLGVNPHFHRIEMKPGKPLYFGTYPRANRPSTLVFGLPGNPVSSMVCFELFVRPAIRRRLGHEDALPKFVQAELIEDYPYRTDRPTYHPSALVETESGWQVKMVPWMGSPDLRALTKANALTLLPVGDHQHRAGDRLATLPLD